MSSAKAHGPSPSRRPRVRKSMSHLPSSDAAPDSQKGSHKEHTMSSLGLDKDGANSKKSRSKSIGPGGLDALKETSGNRRKSANSFQPKSILKPSIPLSPVRQIPARKLAQSEDNQRIENNSPDKRVEKNASDKVPDTPARDDQAAVAENRNGMKDPLYALDGPNEDAEATERRNKKAEIQKRREERRKSMAGRRVSFAPEATLHTWDTEILQDSTTSTGSADTTRRASSFLKSQSSNSDRPGTPPTQTEHDAAKKSPEHQRDAHKKRRRRSSGIPPMNFNDPDVLSSSPFSASSGPDEDSDISRNNANEHNTLLSPSKEGYAVFDEGTMQNIDNEENGDGDLDASLEDAARRAGTRTMDLDANGDISMDLAGDEVTAAFQPWVKQSMGTGSPHPSKSVAKMDQENVNIFSKSEAADRGSPTPSNMGDEDMSMDMTQAMGGVVRDGAGGAVNSNERFPKRKRQSIQRHRSSGEDSELGDGTMDLTTAVGRVRQEENLADLDPALIDEDEELSMEFTSVFGGVKKGQSPAGGAINSAGTQGHVAPSKPSPRSTSLDDKDDDMDMTEAIGSIQQAQQPHKHSEPEPLPKDREKSSKHVVETASSLRSKPTAKTRHSIGATATGSPAVDPFARRDRLRRSGNAPVDRTPEKKPATPPKQVTPIIANERPSTPGKTPPSASVAMRKSTAKKLFGSEIKASRSPLVGATRLFKDDGEETPTFALKPSGSSIKRRSLLGSELAGSESSPKATELLDRRTSITDCADVFAPQPTSRGVRFDDPRAMDAEVTKERDEERRRESSQFIIEQEANGDTEEENATQSLKDLMQSMTPKKNKMKGRKSLAVGSAKGLLGKRPVELDDEDEENSPRTFGRAASPVKKVRLNSPPSVEETMRSSRNGGRPLSSVSGNARPQTPNNGSSPNSKRATTPRSQSRFKDAESLPSAQKPLPTMGQTAPSDAEKAVKDGVEERIGLQDFLNLTNIRFMELTTTKRRPTITPAALKDGHAEGGDDEQAQQKHFEDSIAAGACTIPMLELFQHSCRELKKYISEGRRVVKEIESETLDDNPAIFKEYTTANPSTRAALDNQFKNMKTNARLLSKATWYEWRMKLLDGLQESLKDTTQGLQADDEALAKQFDVVEHALKESQEKREALEQEHRVLRARADELAGCDPEDLETARQRLQTVNEEIKSHSHDIEGQHESISDLDQQIAAAKKAKESASAATKDAYRQREASRGWSTAEIAKVQTRVNELVRTSGWKILGASGTQLHLEFEGVLELAFNAAAYLPLVQTHMDAKANTSPALSLTYAPKGQRRQDPSTTQRFFLQLLRAHLHSLDPAETHASVLLRVVAAGWESASRVEAQIKCLRRRCGVTVERIAGDEKLEVETVVLVPTSESRVDVTFGVDVAVKGEEVEASIGVRAETAYGRRVERAEMEKGLRKRVGGILGGSGERSEWTGAVESLKG